MLEGSPSRKLPGLDSRAFSTLGTSTDLPSATRKPSPCSPNTHLTTAVSTALSAGETAISPSGSNTCTTLPLPHPSVHLTASRNVYSVEQLNNIPTAGQGAAVVNSLLSGIVSDFLQNRPVVIVFDMFLCLFGNASLAVWASPIPLKFVGYILITTGLPAQSLTITWLSEVCQGNATLRGLIVSIGNTMVYIVNSFALGTFHFFFPWPSRSMSWGEGFVIAS